MREPRCRRRRDRRRRRRQLLTELLGLGHQLGQLRVGQGEFVPQRGRQNGALSGVNFRVGPHHFNQQYRSCKLHCVLARFRFGAVRRSRHGVEKVFQGVQHGGEDTGLD